MKESRDHAGTTDSSAGFARKQKPDREVVFYQYEEKQWNEKASYFSYIQCYLIIWSFTWFQEEKQTKTRLKIQYELWEEEKKAQLKNYLSSLLIILCQTDHPKSDS